MSALAGLSASCERAAGAGEVTRDQCVEIVRKQDRLESKQTGGMHAAVQRTERTRIDRCLERATERAYRCVRSADTVAKLRTCESLFR